MTGMGKRIMYIKNCAKTKADREREERGVRGEKTRERDGKKKGEEKVTERAREGLYGSRRVYWN